MRISLRDNAVEEGTGLAKRGGPRVAAREELRPAERQGRFAVFSLIDTLTRDTNQIEWAGDHAEAAKAMNRAASTAAPVRQSPETSR